MRIAILDGERDRRRRGPKPGWHTLDLFRAAEGMGLEASVVPWTDLGGYVVGGSSPDSIDCPALRGFDAVLPRIMPNGSLEQVVFRMDVLLACQASGMTIINPPRSIELAVDKYLALGRLARAGLPTPPTWAGQHPVDARAALAALGGDVVVKPLFGSEGFGVMRITDPDLADRAFSQLQRMQQVIYLQRFINAGGRDLRLLVCGRNVIAAMERRAAAAPDEASPPWRANIARGGQATAIKPTDEQIALALAAAQACDLPVAGVDLLPDQDGGLWITEVNAAPGWRRLARETGVDVARHIIAQVADAAPASPGPVADAPAASPPVPGVIRCAPLPQAP